MVFKHTSRPGIAWFSLFTHLALLLSHRVCVMQTMVISQVDQDSQWAIGSARLSQSITEWQAQLHRRHKPVKMITFDTHDTPSLLWQHTLIFLLWHPLPCGCYSSQIYHFNGEVVRPEDYLRHKYIIVCSFGIDQVSLCPDLLFHDKSCEIS